MTIKLYELAGEDPARRFSPYCWRTRLALAHKGLAFEGLPWRFTEKQAIAFSGQDKVPVLVDGEKVVSDSWAIAEYLEDAYPDRPSLFGGPGGRALAKFFNGWADSVMIAGLARLVVSDIPPLLGPADREYFFASREKRYGMKLAEVTANRETAVEAFRRDLHPLRMVLRERPFLHGEAPAYADAIAFGSLQWPRCVSPFPVLTQDDPIHAWRDRMLDAYGGIARAAPTFEG